MSDPQAERRMEQNWLQETERDMSDPTRARRYNTTRTGSDWDALLLDKARLDWLCEQKWFRQAVDTNLVWDLPDTVRKAIDAAIAEEKRT
jgi:hypothetical protein